MVAQLLKNLSQEKIVLINHSQESKLPFTLKGVVRLVDPKGNTIGLVMDKETLDGIEEEMAAASPAFWTRIGRSRKSGRVTSEKIEKRLHIK